MSEKPTTNNLPAKSSGVADQTEAANKTDPPLFPPAKPGKKPNYGTNNTLELLDKIPSQVVEMKLDDVLTAVKDVDNLCDFARCKTKTSLMGQNCDYCHKRFCFKHGLPEVHGCGEAAKKTERKQFLHPKPAKTIKQEEELEKAKKKLQAKLKDMQVGRMQKTGGGGAESSGKSGAGSGGRKKKSK
ncbi:DNA-binding protein SMUBP-2 isoform X1 [Lucilia sericata]|uniref:DNA-binding protein SMUBP-2 isoform X1 n=1 Tax=Lucilia sericata TaxID=13632 RepID=UPI0018A8598B|nr:DNA-binding protein SMUBP-2 isoform X1 [Lucilia sericata]